MLPVKIGLQLSVSPYTWGFELTPFLITAYFIIMMLFASWCFFKFSKDVAVGDGFIFNLYLLWSDKHALAASNIYIRPDRL